MAGKQWVKGQSGNPNGKPKGTLSIPQKLRKLIDVEPILKKLSALAKEGDVQAARVLLDRTLPTLRATAKTVEIPEMDRADGLRGKADAVLHAIATGRVPPDVGASLVQAIAQVARVAEIDEIERRIAALEKANHAQ